MEKNEKKKNEEREPEIYRPLGALDSIDSLFDYAMKAPYKLFSSLMSYKMPDSDIIDNGDSYTVKIDLPGVSKNDVKLKILGNSLEVKAEKKEENEERRKGYYSKERASMGYYRSIPFPEEVNPKSAKAKMENGTLSIEVEKSENAKGNEVRID
ncbi:Hsp20/alpha crystallin family protein [Candidatus Marsarchaeota archaeon]|nr:Hsp20/alpha crystallin family protein [Candidatus Marsarchaeota archaeon]